MKQNSISRDLRHSVILLLACSYIFLGIVGPGRVLKTFVLTSKGLHCIKEQESRDLDRIAVWSIRKHIPVDERSYAYLGFVLLGRFIPQDAPFFTQVGAPFVKPVSATTHVIPPPRDPPLV